MNKERIKGFADKVFGDMAGAMAAGLGYVGTRTGLFRAMALKGPMLATDVVQASGLQARYVEEWLKGMVCAGYLDYDPHAQTYLLPEEHAYLLASEGTDHFMGGLFAMAPVLLGVAPKVAEAFEKGGGVPFAAFGAAGVNALDMINRGTYEQRFASYWLKAIPGMVERLEAGGRVLDFGCGAGRVALTLARAFPRAELIGIDPDAESIRLANAAAAIGGQQGKVSFRAQSIEDLDAREQFDLIVACDCVHDLIAPQATLRSLCAHLKPDGTLFVMEPKAADHLEENINPIAAMYYGFSVFHCMTQSLAHGGPGLGTCMGPARTEALMREAGFTRFQVLDIKSQVNAFYACGA
jgi:2-polyprenyl-3-methyl-5-hydroxy-6-metoxy-1,4-benzoquinol methylase